jgi:hypothetical protein
MMVPLTQEKLLPATFVSVDFVMANRRFNAVAWRTDWIQLRKN